MDTMDHVNIGSPPGTGPVLPVAITLTPSTMAFEVLSWMATLKLAGPFNLKKLGMDVSKEAGDMVPQIEQFMTEVFGRMAERRAQTADLADDLLRIWQVTWTLWLSNQARADEAARLAQKCQALASREEAVQAREQDLQHQLTALQAARDPAATQQQAELHKQLAAASDDATAALKALDMATKENLELQLQLSQANALVRELQPCTDEASHARSPLSEDRERLEARIDELERDRSSLEQRLADASRQIAVAGAEKEEMQAQKAAMVQALQLTVTKLDAAEKDAKEQLSSLERARQRAAAECDTLRYQLDVALRRGSTAEADLQTMAREKDALETQLSPLKQQCDTLRHQLDVAIERARAVEADLKSSTAEKEDLGARLGAVHAQASALERQCHRASAERDALQQQLGNALRQAGAAEAERQTMAREKEALEAQLSAVEQQCKRATEGRDALQQQLENALKQAGAARGDLQTLVGEKARLETQVSDAKAQRSALERQLEKVSRQASAAEADLQTAADEKAALALQLSGLEQKSQQVSAQRDTLQQQLETALKQASTVRNDLQTSASEKEALELHVKDITAQLSSLQQEHERALADHRTLHQQHEAALKDARSAKAAAQASAAEKESLQLWITALECREQQAAAEQQTLVDDAVAKASAAAAELQASNAENEALAAQVKDITAKISTLEQRHEQAMAEQQTLLADALERDNATATDLQAANTEREALAAQVKDITAQLSALKQDHERALADHRALRQQREAALNDARAANDAAQASASENKAVRTQLTALEQDYQRSLADQRALLADALDKASATAADLRMSNIEKEALASQGKDIAAQLSTLEEAHKRAVDSHRAMTQQKEDALRDARAARAALQATAAEKAVLHNRVRDITVQLTANEEEHQQATAEQQRLLAAALDKASTTADDLQAANAAKEALETQVRDITVQLTALQQEHQQATAEQQRLLADALDKASTAAADLQTSNTEKDAQVADLKAQLSALEEDHKRAVADHRTLRQQREDALKDACAANAAAQASAAEKQDLEKQVRDITVQLTALEQDHEQATAEQQRLLADALDRASTAAAELQTSNAEREALASQVADLKATLSALEQIHKRAVADHHALRQQKEAALKDARAANAAARTAAVEKAALQTQLTAMEQAHQRAMADQRTLLADALDKSSTATADLLASNAKNEALAVQVADITEQLSALQRYLKRETAALDASQQKLAATVKRAATAEAALEASAAEITALDQTLKDAEEHAKSIADCRAEHERTKDKLRCAKKHEAGYRELAASETKLKEAAKARIAELASLAACEQVAANRAQRELSALREELGTLRAERDAPVTAPRLTAPAKRRGPVASEEAGSADLSSYTGAGSESVQKRKAGGADSGSASSKRQKAMAVDSDGWPRIKKTVTVRLAQKGAEMVVQLADGQWYIVPDRSQHKLVFWHHSSPEDKAWLDDSFTHFVDTPDRAKWNNQYCGKLKAGAPDKSGPFINVTLTCCWNKENTDTGRKGVGPRVDVAASHDAKLKSWGAFLSYLKRPIAAAL